VLVAFDLTSGPIIHSKYVWTPFAAIYLEEIVLLIKLKASFTALNSFTEL